MGKYIFNRYHGIVHTFDKELMGNVVNTLLNYFSSTPNCNSTNQCRNYSQLTRQMSQSYAENSEWTIREAEGGGGELLTDLSTKLCQRVVHHVVPGDCVGVRNFSVLYKVKLN